MILLLITIILLFLCKAPILLYFIIIMFYLNSQENFNTDIIHNDKIIPSIGVCSKSCCPNYYSDSLFNDIGFDKSKYTTSNLTCRDGVRDVGCICLNKQNDN